MWVEVVRITVPGRRPDSQRRRVVFPPLPITDINLPSI